MAWSIFSSNLLESPQHPPLHIPLTEKRIALLKELDRNTSTYLPEYQTSLGNYFEHLWNTFFQFDDEFEVILQNQQVIQEKQTLGEFDFILKNQKSQEFYHLEVACKFYLFYSGWRDENPDNLSNWIGPNPQDSLANKWSHLLNHQIQLTKNPASMQILAENNIESINTSIILKGYLFNPAGKNNSINTHANTSHFYNSDNIDQLFEKEEQWLSLEKINWLNTHHLRENVSTMNKKDVIDMLEYRKSPFMVATFQESGDYCKEIKRYFICPRNWPRLNPAP